MAASLRERTPFFALVGLAASMLAAAQPAGTIVQVEGRGEYREARAIDWRTAELRQPVFVSDFVRTLRLARVTILYVDGTQEKLAPNSQLQVRRVVVDGKEKTIIDLQQGRSWMRSKTTPNGLEMRTPSASASVRGTEWEMAVDAEGRATLTVFEGEIDFFNDHGRTVVRANEQAMAERGRAPVKLQLRVSRERMQWVSSATIDPRIYAEFREGRAAGLGELEGMLRSQRLVEAHDLIGRHLAGAAPMAVAFLLAADFEVYQGELGAAVELLRRGSARFPGDERFDAALARIALFRDDVPEARSRVGAALGKRADSPEALVMLGDLERHEGHAREALAAYRRAAAAAATDPRGWRGLGAVESERENVRRARSHLLRAIELGDAGAPAELGTLAGFAGDLRSARAQLREALSRDPANYVALAGLGVVELKAGNVPAALDALLAASAIEPRYARAQVYLAAAYYQAGRDEAAIQSLSRAGELDRKDPLPHLLMSLIHLDRIEPGAAVAAAREAQRRLPFLKSLNQVAEDRKGLASVGAPLAFMGLEEWARSAAHDSYLPFWAASHLFLADRYPGEFNRRAELMQGFVVDPVAFGASNRFQTLVQAPGHYATASLRYGRSDELELREPVVTLAGFDASRFPVAYFAEAVDTRIDPRGAQVSAHGRTLSGALGAKPVHELGFFVYANHLDVDLESGRRDATGAFSSIHSRNSRIDAGARYAPDARSMLIVKAGAGEEHSSLEETSRLVLPDQSLVQRTAFAVAPRAADMALRHVRAAGPVELSCGAEAASLKTPIALHRDATLHFEGSPAAQQVLDQHDSDRSGTVQAAVRWQRGDLRVEAGLAWHGYRKDRDIGVEVAAGLTRIHESYRRDRADPHLGVTWVAGESLRVRGACRRWLRPAALDTLAPVAVAGMPLDDQLVLGGGTLEQCRAQVEWSSSRVFAAVRAERVEVRNLVSPLDGALNARLDVTNLDRLRNRTLAPPAKPDQLEDLAVYGAGTARRAAAAVEVIVTQRIGARAEYLYTDSANDAPAFAGRLIPYLPRHVAAVGMTWAPGHRTFVTLGAIYRSVRFADEINSASLPAGWDAQARIYWETADKRWSLEAFAANLLKRDASDVFGLAASLRF